MERIFLTKSRSHILGQYMAVVSHILHFSFGSSSRCDVCSAQWLAGLLNFISLPELSLQGYIILGNLMAGHGHIMLTKFNNLTTGNSAISSQPAIEFMGQHYCLRSFFIPFLLNNWLAYFFRQGIASQFALNIIPVNCICIWELHWHVVRQHLNPCTESHRGGSGRRKKLVCSIVTKWCPRAIYILLSIKRLIYVNPSDPSATDEWHNDGVESWSRNFSAICTWLHIECEAMTQMDWRLCLETALLSCHSTTTTTTAGRLAIRMRWLRDSGFLCHPSWTINYLSPTAAAAAADKGGGG